MTDKRRSRFPSGMTKEKQIPFGNDKGKADSLRE
jgi:hypothetical protein